MRRLISWGAVVACAVIGVGAGARAALLPPGFVCGMSYARSTNGGATCDMHVNSCTVDGVTVTTLAPPPPNCSTRKQNVPGATTYSDGDGGLSTNYGWYHQQWSVDDPNKPASDMWVLPAGTACGFEESCFRSGQTCLGMNARNGCPAGWTQKHAQDYGSTNGCGFYWCEYQDPNHLCTSSSCYMSQVPGGTICGITDSHSVGTGNGGLCMGLTPTVNNCASLGYNFFGFYDAGNSNGNGVGFCIHY